MAELAPSQPYVADDADLSTVPQTALTKEAERLRKLIGIDKRKADQLTALDRKIARAESALTYLDEQIGEAEKAKAQIAELTALRKQEYGNVFDALLEEESQLSELYAPLAAKLTDATGTLGKLTFVIRRDVDIERWAGIGEGCSISPSRPSEAAPSRRPPLLDAWSPAPRRKSPQQWRSSANATTSTSSNTRRSAAKRAHASGSGPRISRDG